MLSLPTGREASASVGARVCAPSPGTNPSLPACRSILPVFPVPAGSRGYGVAGICRARVRGLAQMWPSGAWLPAGALRQLSHRTPGGVQLQTPRLLSQRWGTTYGRKRRVTGGRGFAGTAHAPMGAQLPVSAAVPVCQPTDHHGPGARHRLPMHRHAPGQEGWVFLQDGPDRRGHLDPALRQRMRRHGESDRLHRRLSCH